MPAIHEGKTSEGMEYSVHGKHNMCLHACTHQPVFHKHMGLFMCRVPW